MFKNAKLGQKCVLFFFIAMFFLRLFFHVYLKKKKKNIQNFKQKRHNSGKKIIKYLKINFPFIFVKC